MVPTPVRFLTFTFALHHSTLNYIYGALSITSRVHIVCTQFKVWLCILVDVAKCMLQLLRDDCTSYLVVGELFCRLLSALLFGQRCCKPYVHFHCMHRCMLSCQAATATSANSKMFGPTMCHYAIMQVSFTAIGAFLHYFAPTSTPWFVCNQRPLESCLWFDCLGCLFWFMFHFFVQEMIQTVAFSVAVQSCSAVVTFCYRFKVVSFAYRKSNSVTHQ